MSVRPSQIDTALAFIDAISRRDEASLVQLADPGIAIVGPRGTATGHDVLRQWFGAVRMTIVPKAALVRDDRVLVLHEMRWLDAAGETTSRLDNASLLHVTAGRVSLYTRDDAPGPVRRQGFRGAPEYDLEGCRR